MSQIYFYFQQTEVPCYTDRKIDEYNKHIRILEIEYKAFVRKLHQLNSGLKTAPWTPRPYESKGNTRSLITVHLRPFSAVFLFVFESLLFLFLQILHMPSIFFIAARDKPLLSLHPMSADVKLGQIEPFQTPVLMHDTHYQDGEPETKILNTEIDSQGINELPLFSNQIISSKQDPQRMDEQLQKEVMMNSDVFPSIEPHNYTEVSGRNPLGLDYSSSEDER